MTLDTITSTYNLPGFYLDATGALCIVINKCRIACEIKENKYHVTAYAISSNGSFDSKIMSSSWTDPQKAVQELNRCVNYAKNFA